MNRRASRWTPQADRPAARDRLLTYAWTNDAGDLVGSDAQSTTFRPSVGLHGYTLLVTDDEGGTATDRVDVIITDSAGPAILEPFADEALEEDGGCVQALIPDYTDVGVIDACGGTVGVDQSPPPGTPVLLGDTVEVVVSATDEAGNITTESFTVTAVDGDATCDTGTPDDSDDTDSEPKITRIWRGGCDCDSGGGTSGSSAVFAVVPLLLALRRRSTYKRRSERGAVDGPDSDPDAGPTPASQAHPRHPASATSAPPTRSDEGGAR